MSDKQLYHVHGRYLALYPDGRPSGEVSYSCDQVATDAQRAIRQAAGDAAAEFEYRAFTWLTVQADPVEAGREYHAGDVGHRCRQCGANFLTRQPWRWGECSSCWWGYLPGRVLMMLASFFAGLALSLLILRLVGYW